MKSSSELFDREKAREFFGFLNKRDRLSTAYLVLCSNEDYARETVLEIAAELIDDSNFKSDSIERVKKLSHPDVIWLEAENKAVTIKIDSIRNISSKVNLKPYEAKKKVVIINEAYKMNEAAQNAFLKTLEEPPLDTIIFLLSNEVIGLLETIISRCKIIRLNGRRVVGNGNLAIKEGSGAIEGFIKVKDNNYLDYFNFEDKNDYRQTLKILYCFFRDAACLKNNINDKSLFLTEMNQGFLEYINKLDAGKITRAIETIDKMYRYSMANVNLRLCQIDTAQSFKEMMES